MKAGLNRSVRFALFATLVFAVSLAPVYAGEKSGREPLRLFYGTKIGLSVLLAGSAITDAELSAGGRAVVGGASVLLGLPASAVMRQSYRRNPEALRRWRAVSVATDLTLSVGLAGYGVYLIGGGDVSDQWAGLGAISAGIFGAFLSGLDLVPFRLER